MEPIDLRHAGNYRDLGGVKTEDGRVLKKGMLIRGTELSRINDKDISLLRKRYGLRTIIDLRTKKEAAEKPDIQIDGVSYYLMPVFDEAVLGISHEKKVHSIKSLLCLPDMTMLYRQMVSSENLSNISNILKKILLLPNDSFSVIFHCSAGKDRTGVLAALLLLFLGVDRNIVLSDYLYTNRGKHLKAYLAYVAGLIFQRSRIFARKLKGYLLAEQEYIQASLSALEESYGSVENYFSQELKFSEKEILSIKDKFLEASVSGQI
ncbi:MAG: tyrosine-protein phosphatase [Treponemataceae bacterium]|nr:tyrosine-protein phosphatase [Treponemataceae bacterium]